MPRNNKPDVYPYNDQCNPNVEGWAQALQAMGHDPYANFGIAYGDIVAEPSPNPIGDKALANDIPQTFVTDNYKPSAPEPGKGPGKY
jgi:hypothetical protein